MSDNRVILTCALTGVLTDPARFGVPVTPGEMVRSARQACDAGASVLHVHVRNQAPGMGHLPSWDPEDSARVCSAIRDACPGVVINLSTGVMGPDIRGPLACLDRVRPEMAALNAGTLNYLKATASGTWAWPPMVFDNPVEKVAEFARTMYERGILPECECFDAGILRSVSLFVQVGMLKPPVDVSLIMGVASGLPCKASWLDLLIGELPPQSTWQAIAIGRAEVWDVHRAAAERGGNLRTGLEDTFYLPDGRKARGNGDLIDALVQVAREAGREVASMEEAREMLHLGMG